MNKEELTKRFIIAMIILILFKIIYYIVSLKTQSEQILAILNAIASILILAPFASVCCHVFKDSCYKGKIKWSLLKALIIYVISIAILGNAYTIIKSFIV